MKQLGNLQLDTLSQAQVSYLQSSSQWPQYAEPKREHDGNLYPENPVPFPLSKDNAEQEEHSSKPGWDAGVADSFSNAGIGSLDKSYADDSRGEGKSWWGSEREYSSHVQNDPSTSYPSYAVDDDKWTFPKDGLSNTPGSPKFSVNQPSPLVGQRSIPQVSPGNTVGGTENPTGLLNGNGKPLLPTGVPQNPLDSADNRPGFGFSSRLLGGFIGRKKQSWANQVEKERQGILDGLQEAASIVDGEEKGRSLSTAPLFGEAHARSLHGTRRKDGLNRAKIRKSQKTKHR